jgi:ADP-ribose pyrophosphatase YjhB (NUDIX family)
MYREKEDRVYYTFPGGGMEGDEEKETCVKRECIEEFGIEVEPIREVYTYENETTIQYFFLCDWTSGEFGSGIGEEFQEDRNKGKYEPTLMPLEKIGVLPLMPPEVAHQLSEDIKTYGPNLRPDTLNIKAKAN